MKGHSTNLWLARGSFLGFKAPHNCTFISQPGMPPQTKLPFSALISPGSAISSLRQSSLSPRAEAPATCSPQSMHLPQGPHPACPCSEGDPEGRHEDWPEEAESAERQESGQVLPQLLGKRVHLLCVCICVCIHMNPAQRLHFFSRG